MTHTFTHTGPGTVACHGAPPLALRIDGVDTPCPDPLASWCRFEPEWTEGVRALACVNLGGASDPVVVEVPEPGAWLGLGLVIVSLVLLKALREYARDKG